jgi:hypothetical protein
MVDRDAVFKTPQPSPLDLSPPLLRLHPPTLPLFSFNGAHTEDLTLDARLSPGAARLIVIATHGQLPPPHRTVHHHPSAARGGSGMAEAARLFRAKENVGFNVVVLRTVSNQIIQCTHAASLFVRSSEYCLLP